jgi:hypothetical protein
MMVRFRFGRETSATAVGTAPKESVRVMDRGSWAETGTELASRTIGIWTRRFAFWHGAGPPEFPTTRFAVAVDAPLQRTIARLRAGQRRAFLGQGSQGFDALGTMRPHHWRADLAYRPPRMPRRLDDEARFQMLQAGFWLRRLQLLAWIGRQSWPTPDFDRERRNSASQ